MKNNKVITSMAIALVCLLFSAGYSMDVPDKTFTTEELSKYNGTNGQPSYVAIDGIVYDVTNVWAWKGGKHKNNSSGSNITELIKNKSPHGLGVVKKLKPVGKLKAE